MKIIKDRRRAAVAVLLAATAVAVILLAGIAGRRAGQMTDISTPEKRWAFIRSLGWEPEEGSETEKEVLLPGRFPPVLEQYNQLQLAQGYDLTKYAGKEIRVYTCTLQNCPEDSRAQCTLYAYRGKLIGGDIHSPAFSGYMRPLADKENG